MGSPRPIFMVYSWNGSPYYELDIGKIASAKCSRTHNALICALEDNSNSFFSSNI
jgi:hypothetical protein